MAVHPADGSWLVFPIVSVRLRRPKLVAALLTVSLVVAAAFAASLWSSQGTSAQEVATPNEVYWNSSTPTVSATIHAQGPKLTWQYDASTQAPNGWELVGFHVFRWIPSISDQLTFSAVANDLPATTRSHQDNTLHIVTLAHRTSGIEYEYYVVPIFERLSDSVSQIGTTGAARVKVPQLPAPPNLAIYFCGYVCGANYQQYLRMRWDHPHLAWDSSTGFHQVSEYTIYHNGSYYGSAGTNNSAVFKAGRCDTGYQLRVRYGLFYTDLLTPTDPRFLCRE